MQYVTIHGLAQNSLLGNGDKSDELLREYIAGIVYGQPTRIFATLLACGKFVALVEYDDATQWATGTFNRMGSFSYGSQYMLNAMEAWAQFGTWVGHYSGVYDGEKAAAERRATYAADRHMIADMEMDGLL